METNMEPTITSETKQEGRISIAALKKMFTTTKPVDNATTKPVENLSKPSKEPMKNMETTKNVNIIDSNFNQTDSEIPALHSKPRDEDLVLEKEISPEEVMDLVQSEKKIPTIDISKETEQMDLAVKTPTERIPIETAIDNLDSLNEHSNQTVSKTALPEESAISSDQMKNISDDTETIISITQLETLEDSIPPTKDEILQASRDSNLEEFHATESPVTSGQASVPKPEYDTNNAKMNMLQKKHQSSAISLKEQHQPSGKSSQSSLSSSGPSSSSLCHLTELSQPKPEALRTTLMCLRQLHGKDAKHLVTIERHLRGLRTGPKTKSEQRAYAKSANDMATRNRTSKSMRTQTKLSKADDEDALGERQALEKFAAHLFAQLERERALKNYEVSKLQMPAEIGYYRAAYDALVTTFGQPYHKCTLELYQQLAGDLGFEAEVFVIDKTPKIINVNTQ